MAKEQDLHDEILKASPLLNAYLGNKSESRDIRILQELASYTKTLTNSELGGVYVGTLLSCTNILAALEMVDSAAIGNPFHDDVLQVGVLVCLGYEIGQVSKEGSSVRIFSGEISKKAIQYGIVKPHIGDLPVEYPLTRNIVAAIMGSGMLMAKPDDPKLKPYEDFLKKFE